MISGLLKSSSLLCIHIRLLTLLYTLIVYGPRLLVGSFFCGVFYSYYYYLSDFILSVDYLRSLKLDLYCYCCCWSSGFLFKEEPPPPPLLNYTCFLGVLTSDRYLIFWALRVSVKAIFTCIIYIVSRLLLFYYTTNGLRSSLTSLISWLIPRCN